MKLKPIPGHPPYQATTAGDVIRGKRTLRPGKSSNGYLTVKLYRDGVGKTFYVHRLILEAFRGPAPEGYSANHLDFDKTNNALRNLEWTTPKQNNRHAKQPLWYRTQTKIKIF